MLAKLIYENPLNQAADIQHFIAEGEPKITFQDGMILANTYSEESNKQPHFVLWLPQQFPADLRITWQFQPLAEPGLLCSFLQQPIARVARSSILEYPNEPGHIPSIILEGSMLTTFLIFEESMRRNGRLKRVICAKAMGFIWSPKAQTHFRV